MNAKRKAVAERIESLERAIRIAQEYLESSKHADWHGFWPLFDRKLRNGKELPPHKDWVKNFFLPASKKALSRSETVLERLNKEKRVRARDSHALRRTGRAERTS